MRCHSVKVQYEFRKCAFAFKMQALVLQVLKNQQPNCQSLHINLTVTTVVNLEEVLQNSQGKLCSEGSMV